MELTKIVLLLLLTASANARKKKPSRSHHRRVPNHRNTGCGTSDFCEFPEDYPEEAIKQLLQSKRRLLDRSEFLNKTEVEHVMLRAKEDEEKAKKEIKRKKHNGFEFGLRSKFETYDYDYGNYGNYKYEQEVRQVCAISKDHIKPRKAKNTKKEFRFIINDGEDFQQLVQVGLCHGMHFDTVREDNPGSGRKCLVEGNSECIQQFLEHKLYSVDEAGQKLIHDTFKFPSCCTCVIKV